MADMNERRLAINDYLTKLVHESKKCSTCAFNDLCFFAYECFPNYQHYVRKDTLPPEEGDESGASLISKNSGIENPCKTCTKYVGNMCDLMCVIKGEKEK